MLSRQQCNTPSNYKDREVPIGFKIKDCNINSDDVNQGDDNNNSFSMIIKG